MSRRLVVTAAAVLLLASTVSAATDWPTYAGGPNRLFFNAAETSITAANAARLRTKWTLLAGAVVTASPSIVTVDVPGEGSQRIAYIQSWDENLYAVRITDGTLLWTFTTSHHPGASYPGAASVHVEEIEGELTVLFGAGENFYSLSATTGEENWRFTAGTGCDDGPGLCGFNNERNEIESSPIVADGKVFFGMDVNDVETGKGGFYALDVNDGRMAWFFDLETGAACTPDPTDNIRHFDGYHSEAELGLPEDFLATRDGCDFDRTSTGCGNVWSSPALDENRGMIFFASSNCDTDNDPTTTIPAGPMPPYDEAVVALNLNGTPAWRWRPREVDNGDLSFGAVPNLFSISVGGASREVLGIGNKDGFYYVIDRDGVNEITGLSWNDGDSDNLPYWKTQVVPGGWIGGIIATAAVDEAERRIYLSTAPGTDPVAPQQPTVHSLNMDTGDIVWTNAADGFSDASFAPTSAVPGLVFIGSVIEKGVRIYDSATGEKLATPKVGFGIASAPAIVDGTVILGHGQGELGPNPSSAADIVARLPSRLTALCVVGNPGCRTVVAGKKLIVKDRVGNASKRRLVVLSKDTNTILAAEPGSAADPTTAGATMTINNPSTGEEQSFSLPAVGWQGSGRPAGAKGYKYKDSPGANGPCNKAIIKPGKMIKISCKGSGIEFDLNENSQGSLGVKLAFGNEAGVEHCMLFGGDISRDNGTSVKNTGLFKAKNPKAPATCP